MRILVADDEEIICQLLCETLQPLGHEIFTATNGLEAVRLVEQMHPGVVILDVTMPGMDGYGVLQRLRSIEVAPHIFVLMLTARAELAELERGLGSGADDYLAKPFQLRELIARVQAAVRIRTLQEELYLRNQQLAAANQALAEGLKKEERLNRKMVLEMEVAARLQKGILSPAHLEFGRVQVCARYTPSTQIGGDFYDLRTLGENQASIFLADAVGHGVSAALLAAMLKTALQDVFTAQLRPSKILTALNRSFQFCSEHGKYLTAFSGILNCDTGKLTYSLAGHVPPMVYRHRDHAVEKLDSPGFCLGIFDDGGYEDREMQLAPGDRLFAYTDGVSEATPDAIHLFGSQFPEKLRQYGHLHNENFIDQLDRDLANFLGSSEVGDDYTLLAIQYCGPD